MSGIYIHVPFCRQACHYCNFHFSTSKDYRQEMVDSIVQEMHLRRDYLGSEAIQSVYFGGGTPSLLSIEQLEQIFEALDDLFDTSRLREVTLEANPDDLSEHYLGELASQGRVNRLSIGTQSFHDTDLHYLHRVHDAAEAEAAIRRAQRFGFGVLTIDLIYGVPTCDDEQWRANLRKAIELGVTHLSCYALTVEPRTALEHQIRKGKTLALDEAQAARQFEILMDEMDLAGFEHYEISNFCKPPDYAIHNSSYWLGAHYLGLGPSAHSYNGSSRQWNVSHNQQYMRGISLGKPDFSEELLQGHELANESIMLGLRTSWGLDLAKLGAMLEPGELILLQKELVRFVAQGHVHEQGGVYRLSRSGKLLADGIISELFLLR